MFETFRQSVLALSLLTLVGSCGTVYRDTTVDMRATEAFDVSNYLGTWYEIARFPVPFQRGCTATTATYTALDGNAISVLNQCRDGTPDGPLRSISGRADVTGPGQLQVTFSSVPFVRAPYWVLWVDDSYETAVVGVPNGRAGWILARSSAISPEKRAQAEAVLVHNGYDTRELYNVPHKKRVGSADP